MIGKEQVGSGREKKVYKDLIDPQGKVVAEYRDTTMAPETRKAIFYLTKIAHLLFPKNTAGIHLVGEAIKDGENNAATIARLERLELDEGHKASNLFVMQLDAGDTSADPRASVEDLEYKKHDASVKDLVKAIRGAGLFVDAGEINFSFSPSGDVQYVEAFTPWYQSGDIISLRYDADRLLAAIQALEEKERTPALRYFDRLQSTLDDFVKRNKFEVIPFG